ncbi:MAG TPA: hypothetical protein VFZ26_04605 [Gemmatimonadales bacterium]
MPDAPAPAGTPRRVFVHCVGSSAGGLDRYAERALVLASGDDLVCVPREVEPEYLGFLSALGLGPAAANVVPLPPGNGDGSASLPLRMLQATGLVERLASRLDGAAISLDPCAGTPDVFALARAMERAVGRPVQVHAGPPDVSALIHQRHIMRERAEALGIPVPAGEVAELASPHGRRRRDLEPLRRAIERQLRATGRVVVRGAVADPPARYVIEPGGDDCEDVLRRLALRSDNRVYLVESLVDATVCSTIHLVIDAGTGVIRRLGTRDRRMGRGLGSAGSRSPSSARTSEEMEEWALAFAGWLRDAGYVGPLGFDFVEYRDPGTGRPRAVLAGVDPRRGEGSYALALSRSLGVTAFVSGVAAVRIPGFVRLRQALGGLLYDPDRGSGIVPYATGCLEQGRGPLVALGRDRLHASELLAKAQAAVDIPAGRTLS